MGCAFLKKGDLPRAIADFDAALARDPRLATSLYGRGVAKRFKGDSSGGRADMEATIKLDSGVAREMAGYGFVVTRP